MKTTSRAVPLGMSGLSVRVTRAKPTTVAMMPGNFGTQAWIDPIPDTEAIALRDALIERYPLDVADPAGPDVCGYRWATAAHGHELPHTCTLPPDHAQRANHRCICYAQKGIES